MNDRTRGKNPSASIATLLGLLWCGTAAAHHSFSAIYDTERTITLTGTVREFQFIHPHPFLVVDVTTAAGQPQPWRAEMDNRFELEGIGITARTFQPGDQVIVSGSPGRSQSRILYLWRLDRPVDKLRYQQVGGTPSIQRVGS